MADALLKYVSDQLKKGYSAEQIRSVLIRQGYSPAIVDGVMDSALRNKMGSPSKAVGTPNQGYAGKDYSAYSSSPSQRPGSKTVMIILAVVVLVIVGGGIFLLLGLFKGGADLDMRATPDKESFTPGDEVGFDLDIFGQGFSNKGVTLAYRVFDENENLIASEEGSEVISTSESYHKSIDLPSSAKPGRYEMKVFANYDDKIASSSFTFLVAEKSGAGETTTPDETSGSSSDSSSGTTTKETCNDGVKNQDEDGIDCGGKCGGYWYDNRCNAITEEERDARNAEDEPAKESCSDGVKNQDETGIDCGGTCGGYWYDLECHTSPKPEAKEAVLTSVKSTGAQLMDIRMKAKSDPEGAYQGCVGFTDESIRDNCIKSVAQTSKESKYCDMIISDNDRDLCYYPFFMEGDYTVCDKLTLKDSLQTCAQLKQFSGMTQNLQAQATLASIPEPETPEEIIPEESA
ncbi:hypothetical protein JW711_04785 [Candidatus Woesearchaeota archaeon]|nr:hypothetical protein [Candidatus Woesearchaeota archaeon]